MRTAPLAAHGPAREPHQINSMADLDSISDILTEIAATWTNRKCRPAPHSPNMARASGR